MGLIPSSKRPGTYVSGKSLFKDICVGSVWIRSAALTPQVTFPPPAAAAEVGKLRRSYRCELGTPFAAPAEAPHPTSSWIPQVETVV